VSGKSQRPSESRRVHPCWPEDHKSAGKLKGGKIGEPGQGGGRLPKAYAYTTAGIAARMGCSRDTVGKLLGARARDPLVVVAAIIASEGEGRATQARIARVLEGFKMLAREPESKPPASLRAILRARGYTPSAISRAMRVLDGRAPVTAASLRQLLDLGEGQIRAMLRTYAWIIHRGRARQPLALRELTRAEQAVAVRAVAAHRAKHRAGTRRSS